MPAAVGRLASSAHVGTTSISSVGSGGSSPSSTSTTMTVMLSRPPAALAVSTSRSAAVLRVARWREHGGDVGVGHLVDEAVAAQHEPVATDERQRPPVDAHLRLDAERPRDDVATGMRAGLVLGDVAGGDELLHVAVIDGDPAQAAVTEQIRARVADVGEHERLGRHLGHDRGDVAGRGSVDVAWRIGLVVGRFSPTFGAARPP